MVGGHAAGNAGGTADGDGSGGNLMLAVGDFAAALVG